MHRLKDSRLALGGTAYSVSGLVHRIYKPEATLPPATVVLLHGRSGTEDAMWLFSLAIPENWLIVAPRGMKADPGGGYSWRLRERDGWPALDDFEGAVTAVVRFMQRLPQLYDADPERIYLMGFSQGAALAYAIAMRYPGLVNGIAGLVGFVPEVDEEALAAEPLRNLPIFMAAGRLDALIPAEQTAKCARLLQQAQAHLDYRQYDTGHRINAQGMRDLKAWWAEREGEIGE